MQRKDDVCLQGATTIERTEESEQETRDASDCCRGLWNLSTYEKESGIRTVIPHRFQADFFH